MRERRKPYRITRRDQLKTLESPVRIEILFGFVASGPCSIAQVARELGRSPVSLYYHVRKLVEVGLLIEAGTRDTGARQEALFAAPSRQMVFPYQSASDSNRAIIRQLTQASLRLAARELERALQDPNAVLDGPRRTAHAGRDKGWLSAAELREVNELLDRLHTIFDKARHGPRKRLFSLALALSHCQPRPGTSDDQHD